MVTGLNLTHRFLDDLPELCTEWRADVAPRPVLVAFNSELSAQLGLDPSGLMSDAGVAVLAGNKVPDGAVPVALGYAGHQFGNYSPRLGDGRALLLGELLTPDDRLIDVHLKGSGPTPYARGGDGKAGIAPMLREFVVSEALHSLGVATTRSLAVVVTGEQIDRTGPTAGAVLTRTAASHIRVGTFEFAVRLGGSALVTRLADHAIDRHYPHLNDGDREQDAEDRYRRFLAEVVDAQAELVARWMLLGFVHGVMNTDNMAVSGEGIDYGPCAFMDRFDPRTVFSSIDHAGRYAYGNQAPVAAWNLARLAETLLDLIAGSTSAAVEIATEIVNGFPNRFNDHWRSLMVQKLGLVELPDSDPTLLDDLVVALEADRLDWTGSFRRLADQVRDPSLACPVGLLADWFPRWIDQIQREGRDPGLVATEMDSVNPVYIPRNHLVDEALRRVEVGDFAPFNELVEVLRDPFTRRDGLERFADQAPAGFESGFQTYCGT